ncbi:hypothetical protein AB0I90_17650 [Micromonospora wenchangensis]|uniref:hypothetical protein n=1 Tax=Micromonospora wenchangensis TaxID=1185415 RepID=UPI0033D0C9CA
MSEVRFSGGRNASGPLVWAQQSIWPAIKRDRPHDGHLNVRFAVPAEPTSQYRDIVSTVATVMSVHEGLRTRFPLADDGGTCYQEVSSSGRVALPTVELAAADVDSYLEEWSQRSFDTAGQWPVRFTLAVSGGKPLAILGVTSHLVLDKFGERALVQDMRALLRGGHVWSGGGRITGVGRAEHEAGERLTAISERAVSRWRSLLESHETRMFPVKLTNRAVLGSAMLVSPAATAAADHIAAKLRVSSASVFMAATAVLVSVLSEREQVVMQSMLSNRFSPSEMAFVGNIAQPWGLPVEVGEKSFEDIANAVYQGSLSAYRMSRFNPHVCNSMRQELQVARGLDELPWFDSFHNDTRSLRLRKAAGPSRAARKLTRGKDLLRHGSKLYVEIREVDDCAEIFVVANSGHLPVGDPGTLAVSIESMLSRVLASDSGTAARQLVTLALAEAGERE